MAKWSVTTEELRTSASVIEEKTKRYNTEWAKLYAEIQNLKSSQWQGIASDAFNSKIEGYRDNFQDMASVLMSYVEFLRSAADNYEKTENAVKDAAGNLHS